MNASQDYPHISEWPAELGPVPTEDQVIQAYAVLAARPRARPKGTRKALAVAAYLSGHSWWPDDLGRAIDHAMGTPNGAGNDPRNVINERGEGLEDLGFVTLHKKQDGQRETWSCTLSPKGEAAVAAYCAAHGIKNALDIAPEASNKNPPWSRDELILALDLYVRSKGNPPGKSAPEIVELSALLNRIAAGGSHEIDYRNPNGVYMKLMNFRRFDPVYRAQGKTGLTRGNKLEEAVWNEFAAAPDRLTNTASAIVANLDDEANISYDYEVSWIEEAEEGRVLTRAHLVRERSRKLVEAKKAECLRAAGKLTCEACDFDFKQTYGQRGDGFIEVHHSLPVHQLLPGTKTKLADLHLVCANCHRMIHARRPWLSMTELKACLDSPPL